MSSIPPPSANSATQSNDDKIKRGEAIVSRVGIPAQPYILIEIDRLMRRPGVDFREVADIVEKDVPISAKVLQLASAGTMGGNKTFSSIKDALLKLGIKQFRNEILSVALRESFSKFGQSAKLFWKHSNIIAGMNEIVAGIVAPEMAEDAYTTGLFHDMAAVTSQSFNPLYRPLLKQTILFDLEITDEEYKLLHSDHCNIGYIFAKSWAIHHYILEAIQYHHSIGYRLHKDKESCILKAILQLSELFYNRESVQGQYELFKNSKEEEALDIICKQLEIDKGYDLATIDEKLSKFYEEIRKPE